VPGQGSSGLEDPSRRRSQGSEVGKQNAECRTQHFRWVGLTVELIEWKIVTIILHRMARSIPLDNPVSQLFDSKVNERF
jgi:hypothetical protein